MTTFIMGHGGYVPPDTFVPMDRSVGVYAGVDKLLAITIGMAVLATPGGYDSETTYTSTGVKFAEIHNYRIGPLTHPEYQKVRSASSVRNRIIFIGFDPDFPGETMLCTDPGRCRRPRHQCDGILSRIRDTDIRLAFCIGDLRHSGLNDSIDSMTITLPAKYDAANAALAQYAVKAKELSERIAANPDKAIDEFHRWAAIPENAGEASFILAASKSLDETLLLHDARKQRAVSTAPSFLNYLYGLPEKTRELVTLKLRGDQRAALAPDADAVTRFFESFFARTTDERYDAWLSLSRQEQERLEENQLTSSWAAGVAQVVGECRKYASYDDQPWGWFAGAVLDNTLSEFGEAEVHQCAAYQSSLEACITFGVSAKFEAKLALWQRLEGNAKAQRLLLTVAHEKPETFIGKPAPDNAAKLLSTWAAEYQASLRPATKNKLADQPAPTVAADHAARPAADAGSGSESDFEFGDSDEFSEYWDDPDSANRKAARDWTTNAEVHVIEYEGRFRFAPKTTDVVTRFPSAAWSQFKVTQLTMEGGTIVYVSGIVDIGAFRTYLAALAAKRTVINALLP